MTRIFILLFVALMALPSFGQSRWPAEKVLFSDSETLQSKFNDGDLKGVDVGTFASLPPSGVSDGLFVVIDCATVACTAGSGAIWGTRQWDGSAWKTVGLNATDLCTGSESLRGDGSCTVPSGGGTGVQAALDHGFTHDTISLGSPISGGLQMAGTFQAPASLVLSDINSEGVNIHQFMLDLPIGSKISVIDTATGDGWIYTTNNAGDSSGLGTPGVFWLVTPLFVSSSTPAQATPLRVELQPNAGHQGVVNQSLACSAGNLNIPLESGTFRISCADGDTLTLPSYTPFNAGSPIEQVLFNAGTGELTIVPNVADTVRNSRSTLVISGNDLAKVTQYRDGEIFLTGGHSGLHTEIGPYDGQIRSRAQNPGSLVQNDFVEWLMGTDFAASVGQTALPQSEPDSTVGWGYNMGRLSGVTDNHAEHAYFHRTENSFRSTLATNDETWVEWNDNLFAAHNFWILTGLGGGFNPIPGSMVTHANGGTSRVVGWDSGTNQLDLLQDSGGFVDGEGIVSDLYTGNAAGMTLSSGDIIQFVDDATRFSQGVVVSYVDPLVTWQARTSGLPINGDTVTLVGAGSASAILSGLATGTQGTASLGASHTHVGNTTSPYSWRWHICVWKTISAEFTCSWATEPAILGRVSTFRLGNNGAGVNWGDQMEARLQVQNEVLGDRESAVIRWSSRNQDGSLRPTGTSDPRVYTAELDLRGTNFGTLNPIYFDVEPPIGPVGSGTTVADIVAYNAPDLGADGGAILRAAAQSGADVNVHLDGQFNTGNLQLGVSRLFEDPGVGLRIKQGSAAGSNIDGGLIVTEPALTTECQSGGMTSPNNTDRVSPGLPFPITLVSVSCTVGGTTPSILLSVDECDSQGANCVNGGASITCNGGVDLDAAFTDAAFDADDAWNFDTGAASGTVDYLAWQVCYQRAVVE